MEEREELVTLSTGVVLRLKSVPMAAIGEIQTQMHKERPKVPTVWLEAKERDEPNPSDPTYLANLKDWDERTSTRMLDAAIMLATEVESLPDGFPKAESEEWPRKLHALGIDVPPVEDTDERYLAWVKLCAAPTAKDLENLMTAATREFGVAEEDVANAAESFPGPTE